MQYGEVGGDGYHVNSEIESSQYTASGQRELPKSFPSQRFEASSSQTSQTSQQYHMASGARELPESPTAEAVLDEDISHFELELRELQRMPDSGAQGSRPAHTFKSGSTYTGQWRGNTRHGFGAQTWLDGASYEGEWLGNAAEGLGRFTFVDGDVYIGRWGRNLFDGLGTYYNSNGTIFYGVWCEDQREGLGVEVGGGMQKDIKYSGTFLAGQKDGSGVCAWPDGSEYRGEWSENRISGRGEYESSNGGRRFKGEWNNSAKHGVGCYNWPDGRSYGGQYARDQAAGFGFFWWADGRKYVGYWEAGKQHGAGKYSTSDGRETLLTWREGHPWRPSSPDEAG